MKYTLIQSVKSKGYPREDWWIFENALIQNQHIINGTLIATNEPLYLSRHHQTNLPLCVSDMIHKYDTLEELIQNHCLDLL